MAHYAFVDENNIVTEVIVGINENELIEGISPEKWYGDFRGQKCIRTSYNASIRGNYAGNGYTYFVDADIFMPPKCHAGASLNVKTAKWDCTDEEHSVQLN